MATVVYDASGKPVNTISERCREILRRKKSISTNAMVFTFQRYESETRSLPDSNRFARTVDRTRWHCNGLGCCP